MVQFLVKVPAEVIVGCTISCGDSDGHGDTHPAKEYLWHAYATLQGHKFDLLDKPRYHPTADKARNAGVRELRRRVREWNARVGL